MVPARISFLISLFLANGGVVSAATWVPINSGLTAQNLGIVAVITDPTTPSTLYALSSRGLISKSTDGASTWTALSGVAAVNWLAIDPQNPSTIYSATSHGILKSVDGGSNWAPANGGLDTGNLNVTMVAIDPLNPSTVYGLQAAIGVYRILKTTDGAESWSTIYTFTGGNYPGWLTIDPSTSSTLYVSAIGGGAILKSNDGGQSWNQIKASLWNTLFAPQVVALAIDPGNSSTLYAGTFAAYNPLTSTTSGIISKSSDGGQTWATISSGIPADAFVQSLTVDLADSSTVYAVYARNGGAGILKSTDAGENWQEIYTLNGDPSSGFTISLAAGVGVFYAGYNDPHTGTGGVLKTGDGGLSWNSATTGLTYLDLRALAIDSLHPGAIFAGGAGGVFRRANPGADWVQLSTPQLGAASFGFGSANPVVRDLLVDFTNSDVLYLNTTRPGGCVFDDKVVFKTTDGGANWNNSISPPTSGCLLGGYIISAPSPVMVMDPTDSATLYLAEGEDEDGGYTLLKSTDGGASWNSIWGYQNGLESGLNALAIDPSNPTTIYAGVGDAFSTASPPAAIGFFKSIDGGANWTNIGLTNTAVTVLAIDPADANTLYAATQGVYTAPIGFRGIFKSADGGATWALANNGLEGLTQAGVIITALAIDPSNRGTVYAATSGDGAYRTLDGGATWTRFSDGFTNLEIRALSIAPDALYAATAGGIFMAAAAPASEAAPTPARRRAPSSAAPGLFRYR